jgi:trehalose utilization protein
MKTLSGFVAVAVAWCHATACQAAIEIDAPAKVDATYQGKLPKGIVLEEQPKDKKAAKIVLVAGSNHFKPGEHEYVGGCAVLMDLLRQTPGVFPVLALDWPKKAETFAGAKAVVFFFDGGDKHGILKGDRLEQMQKLADARVGFVFLHQGVDVSKDLGERMRSWAGAAWEKGYSQRAHWVENFQAFAKHPISRGVEGFKIDDGWLYKLRFVENMNGVTPLVHTNPPKKKTPANEAVVSWAYQRKDGGRSFAFTGCHLHASFAEEGYRRFLVNGILWTADVEVPARGAPVALDLAKLKEYLPPPPPKKEAKTEDIRIVKAKESTYYGKWKTGELLAKYCDKPVWQFDKAKDLVIARGKLKKDGKEIVARFKVYFDWVDKSNTRKDWIVVDEGALIAGKELLLWKPVVFVEEYRLMAGNGKEK